VSDPGRASLKGRKPAGMLRPGEVYIGHGMRWYPWSRGTDVEFSSPFANPHYRVRPLADAVALFAEWIEDRPELIERARAELRGKTLACWCPVDGPCHADVLVELANGGKR